jgi:hypothetical protein
MVQNTLKQKENPIFSVHLHVATSHFSVHLHVPTSNVYFRKTPRFVVSWFGLSQSLWQRQAEALGTRMGANGITTQQCNYSDLGQCYLPQPSEDNIDLCSLNNSGYPAQPHPIIANYSK